MKEPSEEVKEVERRYEETIDKMQQLVDRLKTERMSQAEFEQYAKEHGYIISTTNIIEQIRAEIPDHLYKLLKDLPSDSNEGTIENVLMKAVENGTPIPDNATNGEVFGKIMDYMFMDDAYITTDKNGYLHLRGVKDDWWNAPYQKGGK